MKRLIKFDIIHPNSYLLRKQAEAPEIHGMDLGEYRQWLLDLASNYSDFYTYYLNRSGAWEAEEYFFNDAVFTRKVAEHLFGKVRARLLEGIGRGVRRITKRRNDFRDYIARAYLAERRPDVIFARSQPQPSAFWQPYRHDTLLVARLSARLPFNWHPNDFDLVYTDQPDFKHFFELHGTETIINDQGFDARIVERLEQGLPSPGVVFVGGLGTQNFLARTLFFERIAGRTKFTWWGYWWDGGGDGRTLADFPGLERGFRGVTSGMEMYQTYHDATICLNDYVDTANGVGFNQRMFEVMGVGGFLLTRAAPNFSDVFPEGIFATYEDEEDCLRQIDYYLAHPGERAEIAARGQQFILEQYNYERIAAEFSSDLLARLGEGRPPR
ncbi:glycosyltransferase [Lewinella sp. IMCC34183]|uniref:glycosyltransferase family protein n=1 Tax=Lewinella sp. IMCC34183 TaxID=2248762 RepID=UPI000E26FF0D|nr:glycosyltransferase [Lewinella sp. IMCC34183]